MLGGVLGSGATSRVHDGWDLQLSRRVAIKLLQRGIDARPPELTGRHVVGVHDVGEHDGVPFIVMERLPGVSLADSIARGPLEPAFVEAALDGVLDALAEAHSVGVLHRNIKPGNILLTARAEAKLADFGAGVSLPYLSPDRLASKPATALDDLYAVGVVGYEALTGRRPFPQQDPGALAYAILHDDPPPLASLRPDVPAGLVTVIEQAMTRDPTQRFDHADAMRAALTGAQPAPISLHPNGVGRSENSHAYAAHSS